MSEREIERILQECDNEEEVEKATEEYLTFWDDTCDDFEEKNMYKYGMRLRGFSIGCQPMNGLEEWQDTDGKYYSELTYSRKLSTEECEQYDLDYIGEI